MRRPSVIAWLVAAAMSVGLSVMGSQAYADMEPPSLFWLQLFAFLVPTLISALLIFFLARALLTEASGFGRPLYARFVGIYLLAVILVEFLHGVGGAAVGLFATPALYAYATTLVSALTCVVVFPLFVRCFATAAGIEEPRLGRVWSFVYEAGRPVLFWYVACTAVLDVLGVFILTNIVPFGAGNDLPGNIVDGAISATSQVMRSMLDIVAVKMVARGWREDAEVFA